MRGILPSSLLFCYSPNPVISSQSFKVSFVFLFISSMLMLVWSRAYFLSLFLFYCIYPFGDLMLMFLKFRSLTCLSFELQSHVPCLLVIYWIFNLIFPNQIIHLSSKYAPHIVFPFQKTATQFFQVIREKTVNSSLIVLFPSFFHNMSIKLCQV